MTIAYGIFLAENLKPIYECALSIKSISLYNKGVDFVVYTNTVKVRDLLKSLVDVKNLTFIITETFTNACMNFVNDGSGHNATIWCTQGIFYRFQAMFEFDNLLYLDTDTLCTGKLKLPSNKKDVIYRKEDKSGNVCYSPKKQSLREFLSYLVLDEKNISTYYLPDESMLTFGFKDKIKYVSEFKNLVHMGRIPWKNKCEPLNIDYYNELSDYIKSLSPRKKLNTGYFESFYTQVYWKYIKALKACRDRGDDPRLFNNKYT